MKPAIQIISERISQAIQKATGQNVPAIVTPATDPKFGDYQSNNALALAKQLKANPRQLAEKIIAELQIDDICQKPEIAGAGFINLRLNPDFVAKNLREIVLDKDSLGIEKTNKPQTVVVDFSGPNIAKEMHVGHLRSTIIGDCIRKLRKCQNHNPLWQNHFGDWGTNFGMVILGLWHMCMAKKHGEPLYYHTELDKFKGYAENKEKRDELCRQILKRHEIDWLEDSEDKDNPGDGEIDFHPFLKELQQSAKDYQDYIWREFLVVYQFINALEDSATGMGLMIQTRDGLKRYESLSSHVTYMLQRNDKIKDEQEWMAWNFIRKLTLKHCNEIYKMLGIDFDENIELRGESFYNDMLPDVVNELRQKKDSHGNPLAVESEGAICVFPEGFKTKDDKPMPFIIQKTDGAYLYATFDLAAIRYRVNELKADEIIYVTDARQKQHFEMLFAVAEMAGWANRDMLHHIQFGSVLGEDGKPLKTRSGENVKLKELLDEAVKRAKSVVQEKNPELPDDEKENIAQAVGIGAVKYADYSNNRTSDYIFSYDKMLAMDGNTAPYMQYAYARVCSIFKKGNVDIEKELNSIKEIYLNELTEFELAKQLIRYSEAFNSAIADFKPNFLTTYLYELAQKFSAFYNACPVLDANPKIRPSRLLLCDLTAKIIRHGLENLLGIKTIERM